LGNVDLVAIMEAGRIKAMGPRDEVLQAVMKRNATPAPARPAGAPQGVPQGVPQASPLREVG
jgi:ATP-binding cassette subfamily C protein